ncbi:MAG: IclR family transcriptional regulator [Herbaspirillum sp.]|jgi:IclR family KDG regulon transcriptional repressor|nr:IclR family transcriptional regulator [Herbaspirillum sp.]
MLQEVNVESVEKPKAAAEKTRLSSVANAIRLVKTFSDDDYEIGISNLAKRLLLPKSTVHRLAATLIDAGLLEQNPENGKYHLGLVVFELGSLVRRKMDFSTEAKPYLMSLREKTGETVHLAILDYSSILCVNTLESKQTIRMTLDVGRRKPAYCTAEGKVLLAYQSPEVVERMLSGKLVPRTPGTIVDEEELRQELIAIRSRGYAIDDEESELGLRSLAAPVRNYTGDVIAATSIAGPSQRLTKKILLSFATDVVTASESISQRLGYNPARARRRI